MAGLWGVLFSPFLHASWWHLISNTAPFIALGWAVLLSGVRTWLVVTAIVILVGGFATWLVAPSGLIVGASGLVFGWLGYLIARAVFSRRLMWIRRRHPGRVLLQWAVCRIATVSGSEYVVASARLRIRGRSAGRVAASPARARAARSRRASYRRALPALRLTG